MFVLKRPQVSLSTTGRPHLAMAPGASDSEILKDLSHRVSETFDQAQSSVANHRNNYITLYKLHTRAASITQAVNHGESLELAGEHCFGDAFLDMVNRVLAVKKGPAVADRIVKFIGGYVKYMNEKGALCSMVQICVLIMIEVLGQKFAGPAVALTSSHVDGDDDDTLASRFIARLLKWLFRGFLSKNKIVRFRSVSIVSEMISYLGEIEYVRSRATSNLPGFPIFVSQ
jgi:condensin complex subunit 3